MKLSGMSIMAIAFALVASILFALGSGLLLSGIGAGLLKFAVDYLFLHRVLKLQERLDLLRYFLWFECYIMAYAILLPFIVLLGGRVVWKGRSY